MRFLLKVILISIIYYACEPSDELSEAKSQQASDPINIENYEEYILVNMDSKQMIFGAERKNQEENNIGAKLVVKYKPFGAPYHSLVIWGGLEDKSYREYQRIGSSIEEFEGTGIYKTGISSGNNCNFFHFGTSWHSHYDSDESGYIEITLWDEETVEGNFDILVYNANDKLQTKNLTGSFLLKVK
ncbi:hypothetical protein [Christiangramia sp. SM2212]|uniref:Uncharacterized protein n=1 Tax=Christiangramia sediminicola TaxID=3073267 RepID=A0ABU1ET27_9FLAO|nr:hypothetical protein [Christiangramia sp. SM2212]MDR5591536.1 hypothetical protein [Christiangramia sp. SM2212]